MTATPKPNVIVRAATWLDDHPFMVSSRVAAFTGFGMVVTIAVLLLSHQIADGTVARDTFLVLEPVALLLLGAFLVRGTVISVGAAAIIVFDLYVLGRVGSEVSAWVGANKVSGAWPQPTDVTFLTTFATQVLVLAVIVCVVAAVVRGDPWVFMPAVVFGVGISAVLLSAAGALQPKTSDPLVADLVVTAPYVGPDVPDGQQVSVVFLVPKLDAYGHAYDLEQRTHSATADGPSSCMMQPTAPCTVKLHVIRGAKDADLATWLADAGAAQQTTIIGPSASPSPS